MTELGKTIAEALQALKGTVPVVPTDAISAAPYYITCDVAGVVVDLLTRFYAHHRAVIGTRSPAQLKALAARIASQGIEGPAGELEKKYGVSLIAFRDQETGGGNAADNELYGNQVTIRQVAADASTKAATKSS